MSTRDSGLIDLFAIHKEEEARVSAAPSGPPPAMSMDVGTGAYAGIDDDEIEGFAASRQKAHKRMKLIGGMIGAVAVIGIIVAGITIGGGKEAAQAQTAAAAPPPPAVVAPPPPAAEPPPPAAAVPAPPPTAKPKPEYTPATAAAAYNAQQGKKKAASPRPAPKSVTAGIKLTKVQSAGVTN
jgi:hypothetical protein